MQIALFMIVLVAVFALKAASIVFAADDAIWKSTSFSWMKPKAEDTVVPASELQGAEQGAAAVPVRVYGRRHVKVA